MIADLEARCGRRSAQLTRLTAARAAADRTAANAARGSAVPESPALQHRAGARRRDAAQLPRRRPPRLRALPRGGAVRGRRARTARLSAARPELRVDRRARPRDLRLPDARPLGIGRPLARSRACTAGCRVFATPRALALSYVDPYVDYTGPGHRLRRRRPRGELGDVRLAAGGHQRLEGRAHAARLPASADQDVGRAVQASCGGTALSRRTAAASRSTNGTRALDVVPEAVVTRDRAGPMIRSEFAASVEVEVPRRLGDRLLVGLLERFLEAPRQRVAAGPLGVRPTAERSPRAGRLPRPGCAARRSAPACCRARARWCDTTRPRLRSITSVDWQHGQSDFELGFEPRHQRFPSERARARRPAGLLRTRFASSKAARRWAASP